jgi:drug/metabolite transporter (DMT)-like permease
VRLSCVNRSVPQPASSFKLKNRLFIALIVLSNCFGNLCLAIAMRHMPSISAVPLLSYLAALLTNPWLFAGTTLLAVWMVSTLSMYTWADLTYILPVTASGYIITALLSRFVLNEQISPLRWAGSVVIALGVVLVSETPERTKPLGVEE